MTKLQQLLNRPRLNLLKVLYRFKISAALAIEVIIFSLLIAHPSQESLSI